MNPNDNAPSSPFLPIIVITGLGSLLVWAIVAAQPDLPPTITRTTEAQVLSVDDRVVEGSLDGGFLSSPDGEVGEINVVGVKLDVMGITLFKDLHVNNAILSYFRDRKTLPVRVVFYRAPSSDVYRGARIYLKGNEVDEFSLDDHLQARVLEYYRENTADITEVRNE